MNIDQFLAPADALVGLRASDKAALLRDLAARAGTALQLSPDLIAGELAKRESLGSTGLGDGVAIPHTRLPGLSKPFGIVAQLKRPLKFDAIDGKPVDIVFLLLMPAEAKGEQLHALASVARRLRDKDALKQLRAAGDAAALYRAMVG